MATNLGRNTFVAPGINTANLSLFKNVPFGEKRKLQFRIEMYNAFNHPSYSLGSGTVQGKTASSDAVRGTTGFITPGLKELILSWTS